MAEFTELPIAAGPLVPRVIYNELLNAINNRRAVVLPDATAAFTIYNSAGDATSATVEIDTAADEIYLIVVGGADASNTTLDLTLAANDTITELVAAINALGFSWEAVEMSGAQSAHANNDSDTLLTLGPADVLGAAHITWFTNYAPNGVMVRELYGHIVAYRAAIDALVTYFYIEASLGFDGITAVTATADKSLKDVGAFAGYDFTGLVFSVIKTTGGDIGDYTVVSNTDDKIIFTADPGNGTAVYYYSNATAYTANSLHSRALGDIAWDAAGAPNLTPPCLPHKKLWNDMKLCLDLFNWYAPVLNETEYLDGVTWEGTETDNAVWATAITTYFGTLAATVNPYTFRIGRAAQAELAAGDYTVRDQIHVRKLSETFVIGDFDILAAINASFTPTIVDGYHYAKIAGHTGGQEYFTNLDIDIWVEGVKTTSAPTNINPEAYGAGAVVADYVWFHLDDIGAPVLNTDGTANNFDWLHDIDYTASPGIIEWPAPVGGFEQWSQQINAYVPGSGGADWSFFLKLDWD